MKTTLLSLALACSALANEEVPRLMQLAIMREDVDLLEKCLASGLPVDGNSIDKEEQVEWTALMLAAAWQKPKSIEWLLDHGANTFSSCAPRCTALDITVATGNKLTCELLAEPTEKTPERELSDGLDREAWSSFHDCLPYAPRWFVLVNGQDPKDVGGFPFSAMAWSKGELIKPKLIDWPTWQENTKQLAWFRKKRRNPTGRWTAHRDQDPRTDRV